MSKGTMLRKALRAPLAGLLVALVVGAWTLPVRGEGRMAMAEFAVLMQENDGAWGKLSPEEQEQLLKRYYAWVDDLRQKDILRYGKPLSSVGRHLRVVDGAVVDGPFTETKEVLTGFFIIEAVDLDAAVAIAKGCPALTHGEQVIVRQCAHD